MATGYVDSGPVRRSLLGGEVRAAAPCARMPLAASQTLRLLRQVAGFSRSDSSPDHLEVTMNDGWQKRSGVPIGRKGR